MANPSETYVFLDRDGTVIKEKHYLADPQQVELLPGAAQAMRRLREWGLGLVLVTNQSGLGRGYFDTARLAEIHQRLGDLLAEEGVLLDGVYFCPHLPDEGCRCRKPRAGMVEQAADELRIGAGPHFVVGDKVCDIEMGQEVKATTVLVRTGYGVEVERLGQGGGADYVVDDLTALVELIAAHSLVA